MSSGGCTLSIEPVTTFTKSAITGSQNQNAATYLEISNTTSGTASQSYLRLTSDSGVGSGFLGKRSNTYSSSGILTVGDLYLANQTKGDISIYNQFASGSIKFASGGSTTTHFTISSTGISTFNASTTTSGTTAMVNILSSANTYNTVYDASLYIGGKRTDLNDNDETTGYRFLVSNTGAANSVLSIQRAYQVTNGANQFPDTYDNIFQIVGTNTGNSATLTSDDNSATSLGVTNTVIAGSGTSALAQVLLTTTIGTAKFLKANSGYTGSGIVGGGDLGIVNTGNAHIAINNQFSTGEIRFSNGTGTTPMITLTSNGHLLINTTTNGTYFLDVNGDVNVTGKVSIAAGTATISPLDFTPTSAVLKTTPQGGDVEVDANGQSYYTIQNSNRGVILTEQFITLTTAYTTPVGTSNVLKALFNSPTNGTLTVTGSTTYYFECYFTLTAMSATSGTFSFGLGGTATYSSGAYFSQGLKGAITASAALMSNQTNLVAAVIGSATANTQTVGYAYIKGKVVVSTGGTIIPSFSLSTAAAAVVGTNAFFRLTPVGINTVQSVGNWS